jgi:hypothetical protein
MSIRRLTVDFEPADPPGTYQLTLDLMHPDGSHVVKVVPNYAEDYFDFWGNDIGDLQEFLIEADPPTP